MLGLLLLLLELLLELLLDLGGSRIDAIWNVEETAEGFCLRVGEPGRWTRVEASRVKGRRGSAGELLNGCNVEGRRNVVVDPRECLVDVCLCGSERRLVMCE